MVGILSNRSSRSSTAVIVGVDSWSNTLSAGVLVVHYLLLTTLPTYYLTYLLPYLLTTRVFVVHCPHEDSNARRSWEVIRDKKELGLGLGLGLG